MAGPENKARAEEYCWGREFIDLVTDFPGAVKNPAGTVQRAAAAGAAAVFDCVEPAGASEFGGDECARGAVRHAWARAAGRGQRTVGRAGAGGRGAAGLSDGNQNFKLPEDDAAPVIMVGPGTGVAPFRAFLEERQAKGASGDNWLFFGDQHRASDFLYEEQFAGMREGWDC